ncbi:amino acid permease-domain-containing protein [Lasiosphaeris hirsuta]|uniref:Amino acid permease-domain-containing protein n=1 Tax=Lasiosphaeris hirsuta TaxID=260670 RepID=A0AA40A270_9PEZI|nr:amino acid permease-domain-containing protein [Lasiosphaeris hirsuta]
MPFNWRRPFSSREAGGGDADEASLANSEVSDGSLTYTLAKGGNDSPPAYQEASGAPVETSSPLGYSVGAVTIIFLNISKMIGTGVYSTPSGILSGTGSVGLSMIYWAIGFFTSIASLSTYLEYAAYFPNRSGSEVVYLEQAYPRPRWLFPTGFAFLSVVLSFSSGNSIVLAQYLFRTNGAVPTPWQLKGAAVAGYTVAVLAVVFSTRWSYRVSNAIGIVKVLTLIFISLTGLIVLGGHVKRVPDPHANFVKPFEGEATPYGLTNALYKIVFSYAGFENAFNVVNEVKSPQRRINKLTKPATQNPIKQLRRNSFIALGVVTIFYILANIAYFAAVPKEDLKAAKQIAAGLFFTNVFGPGNAVKGLNFLIALSSFGNIVAVLLGQSRLIRECGRQGVLPFPRFWASTRPFGTPLGPYAVKYALTVLMIVAPPAGDAFNFITDLQVYPNAFFNVIMAAGIYAVRYRRKRLGLGRAAFRAWDVAIVFNIVVNLYLVVMPWYPPAGGQYAGDVSFWYATYVVVGIGLLLGCGAYYYLWISVIPRLRGYRIRQEVLTLDDGASSHRLIKVPVGELEAWDATHDAVGRTAHSATGSGDDKGSLEKSGELRKRNAGDHEGVGTVVTTQVRDPEK